jgi:hypothetical protein
VCNRKGRCSGSVMTAAYPSQQERLEIRFEVYYFATLGNHASNDTYFIVTLCRHLREVNLDSGCNRPQKPMHLTSEGRERLSEARCVL